MKSKAISFLAICLLFVSLSGFAQTTVTPQVKKNADVQVKVSPTIKQDTPGSVEKPVVTVKTSAVTNVTEISAVSGYSLTIANGGVTKHGICLSRAAGPTISSTIFGSDKSHGPDFVVQLTGLIPNTKFYIRAFATTTAGTTYGNEVSFTTMAGKK
jgi:pectinesterase